MTFEDFVMLYWKKQKGRSGKNWDVPSVSDMEGMPIGDTMAFFTYCENKGNLTDAQLLTLSPNVKQTPFGLILTDSGIPSSMMDRKISDLTVREFLSLKQ